MNQTIPDSPIPGHFRQLKVSALFADLRGFTAISAEYPAKTVIRMLNRYLSSMSEIVLQHGGMVDKFMGDSIMATFGTPQPHADDLKRALACAVRMQLAMDEVNRTNQELDLPPLYMGIGINTGKAMAGWLGSKLHAEYTVIGDSVNLASRIESFSLRGQILIGHDTFKQAGIFVKTGIPNDIFVKGKTKPVQVHEVLAIPSLALDVPRREARRSQRVKVRMPFTYQKIENKIVSDQVLQGTIRDISYFGIQAEFDQKIQPLDDIKLSMDLSLIGYHAGDIYGKVVRTIQHKGKHLAAVEFTSITLQNEVNIRQFVQMLIQGCEKAA